MHDEVGLLVGNRSHFMTASGHHSPCIAVFLCQQFTGSPATLAINDLNAVFGFAKNQRFYFLAVPNQARKVFHVFIGDGVAVVRIRRQAIDVEPVKAHFRQQRIATVVVRHFIGDRRFLIIASFERGQAHLLIG